MPLGIAASCVGSTDDTPGFCGVSGSVLMSIHFLQEASEKTSKVMMKIFLCNCFMNKNLKLELGPYTKTYTTWCSNSTIVNACTTIPSCKCSICIHAWIGTGVVGN